MTKPRSFNWSGVEYQSAEYYRLWRKANANQSREYHRAYDSAMYKKYPERERARRKRWADANKQKIAAHRKVANALKHGLLVKQLCVCGSSKVIAHHPDYTKPLEVLWLCELHHKQWHREMDYIDTPDLTTPS